MKKWYYNIYIYIASTYTTEELPLKKIVFKIDSVESSVRTKKTALCFKYSE